MLATIRSVLFAFLFPKITWNVKYKTSKTLSMSILHMCEKCFLTLRPESFSKQDAEENI